MTERITRTQAADHLRMVVQEFESAKDTLPEHVENDRAAILTVLAEREELLHRTSRAERMVASLEAHQHELLSKLALLEDTIDRTRAVLREVQP
jgi:chromosome segregation ATPase